MERTKVRLGDGVSFDVNVDVKEFRECFREALADRSVIEVDNPDGKRRFLNPVQVLYFEDLPTEKEVK